MTGGEPAVERERAGDSQADWSPAGEPSPQLPFNLVERVRLTSEIVLTYAWVRLLLHRHPLPEVLRRLRRRALLRFVAASEVRLAYLVQRVLRLVPADTRCLMSSMVLLAMLEHRSVTSSLVIATSADGAFSAHAWIEQNGQPLLWPGGAGFARLVEL